jgi:undecaprenyl-diphosphatase
MSLWFALFLGLVQGVAEFLPVSSSGHLALLQHFFRLELPAESALLFDVLLHLGTLAAVFAAYRRELGGMLRALSPRRRAGEKGEGRLLRLLCLGSLPLAPAALLKDRIEGLFTKPVFIGCALLFTGCLLYISGRVLPGGETEKTAKASHALGVGCMQALALLPGVSRSGSTIAAGLLLGFGREFAVRYSFLLSVPAVLGAGALEVRELWEEGFDPSLLPPCLLGAAAAAVAGFFAIRLVRRLTEGGRSGLFSWYCWGAGALAILLTIFRG